MSLLADHAVIVTGAGRGLGRAYALDVAAHGASVAVNDIDAAEAHAVAGEILAADGAAVASGHDVTGPVAVDELITLCTTTFGRLDGLVNNAGLYHEALPWEESSATLRRAVLVNVLGALQCQAAATSLPASPASSSASTAAASPWSPPTPSPTTRTRPPTAGTQRRWPRRSPVRSPPTSSPTASNAAGHPAPADVS